MNVDATSATGAGEPLHPPKPNPMHVDYETFLKLLVAEMKNQDPLNPMQSHEYVAQLAAFSQVEQSIRINQKLEAMIEGQALSQAGSLIGKYIEAMDGSAQGIVQEVRIFSDGVVAKLDNGEEILISAGIVISDAPPEPSEPTEPEA
jgi:flagellar basal-body rod modification protein FlgD